MGRRDKRERQRGLEAGTRGCEAEQPEAAGLWSGVKGVAVNPEGESRHGHARQGRKERIKQKWKRM